MHMRSWLPILMTLAACGEDDPPPPPKPGGAAPAAAAAAAAAANGKHLTPQIHIEDRVADPAEKASLRHQFKDRDFAVEQSNRDPFQSFVVLQPGMGAATEMIKRDITKRCTRDEQMVATNYPYSDLRLVGIVAQGTQRKVLMMDPGNLGHIIKRGDCVGKEHAVVKDIGTGYVTFVIEPEEAPANAPPTRSARSVSANASTATRSRARVTWRAPAHHARDPPGGKATLSRGRARRARGRVPRQPADRRRLRRGGSTASRASRDRRRATYAHSTTGWRQSANRLPRAPRASP